MVTLICLSFLMPNLQSHIHYHIAFISSMKYFRYFANEGKWKGSDIMRLSTRPSVRTSTRIISCTTVSTQPPVLYLQDEGRLRMRELWKQNQVPSMCIPRRTWYSYPSSDLLKQRLCFHDISRKKSKKISSAQCVKRHTEFISHPASTINTALVF